MVCYHYCHVQPNALAHQMELVPSLCNSPLQAVEIFRHHNVPRVILAEVPVPQRVVDEAVIGDCGVQAVPFIVRIQRVSHPVPLSPEICIEINLLLERKVAEK